jgi:hypothetical protein
MRGKKNREGAKSGTGRLEQMKLSNGINDRDDKSNGIEILVSESFSKIKPTDPLMLTYQTTQRKRNWSDSSGISLDKTDSSRLAYRNNIIPFSQSELTLQSVSTDVVWSVNSDWEKGDRSWVINVQLVVMKNLFPIHRP